MKKILKLAIVVFVCFIFSSAVLASKTYVVYENSESNTYIVPHKVSGKNEIYVLRQKANELNPVYYRINEIKEEKDRLLEKKFRRIHSWFKPKDYYGYDEEVFGSKKLYLDWKDAESVEEKEDFHPTKGYDCFKGKNFFERIEKYSLKK